VARALVIHLEITGARARAALAWLAVCTLLAAAVIGPVSMGFAPRPRDGIASQLVLNGADAADHGWVTTTPHPSWPEPTQWQYYGGRGREHFGVWSTPAVEGRNGRQMDLWRWGWPLSVFELAQFWWDWDDPALKGPSPEPRERVVWGNLAAGSLLLGAPLWLLGLTAAAAAGRRGRACGAALLRRWRAAGLLVLVLLVGFAANPYVAACFAPTGSGGWDRNVALWPAPATWPAPTPHKEPWPAPERYDISTRLGLRHDRAAAAPGGTKRLQMEAWRWGWPRPVYERLIMWWDWDDPAMKGPDPTPPTRVIWSGVGLNPVIVGLPVWLALCVPLAIGRLRRGRRRRAGRCVWCGYPVGIGPVCTECGRAARGRLIATAGGRG
jgi:hypothetical protein